MAMSSFSLSKELYFILPLLMLFIAPTVLTLKTKIEWLSCGRAGVADFIVIFSIEGIKSLLNGLLGCEHF